jgi:hyperosmotically inducible protein
MAGSVNSLIQTSYRILATAALLGLAGCGQDPAPKPGASGPTAAVKPPAQPKAAPEAAPAEKKPQSKSEGDRALARRVKDALLAKPDLKAHAIDITADNGAVTLFGTADSLANRKMAGDIASGIEGVKSVENKLVVASGS